MSPFLFPNVKCVHEIHVFFCIFAINKHIKIHKITKLQLGLFHLKGQGIEMLASYGKELEEVRHIPTQCCFHCLNCFIVDVLSLVKTCFFCYIRGKRNPSLAINSHFLVFDPRGRLQEEEILGYIFRPPKT